MSNDTNSGLFSYVTLYECSSLYHKLTFELYENNKLTFELFENNKLTFDSNCMKIIS
jgi:hypothetical protein